MQKQVAGMENPLLEAGAFRADTASLSGIKGGWLSRSPDNHVRLLIDENRVVSSPSKGGPELVITDVADLFAHGIKLEENPSTQNEAIKYLFEGS